MLACALKPARRRMGSRLTLPDRIRTTRSRCACPFFRSQLRKASAARIPSGAMPSPAPLRSRSTRIGSSSIASTTARSFSAKAANTSSPLRRQLPASIPARSFTRTSGTLNSSIRPPAPRKKLSKAAKIRRHAPCKGSEPAPISAIASAAVSAPSTSTKTVSNSPPSSSRRSSSRTRLVLPMRRCAVTRVWIRSRTRSASAARSVSRSKNLSPSTQFAPAFLSAIAFSQRYGWQQYCWYGRRCQAGGTTNRMLYADKRPVPIAVAAGDVALALRRPPKGRQGILGDIEKDVPPPFSLSDCLQPVRLRRRGRSPLRRPNVQIRLPVSHPVSEPVKGRPLAAHPVAVERSRRQIEIGRRAPGVEEAVLLVAHAAPVRLQNVPDLSRRRPGVPAAARRRSDRRRGRRGLQSAR